MEEKAKRLEKQEEEKKLRDRREKDLKIYEAKKKAAGKADLLNDASIKSKKSQKKSKGVTFGSAGSSGI